MPADLRNSAPGGVRTPDPRIRSAHRPVREVPLLPSPQLRSAPPSGRSGPVRAVGAGGVPTGVTRSGQLSALAHSPAGLARERLTRIVLEDCTSFKCLSAASNHYRGDDARHQGPTPPRLAPSGGSRSPCRRKPIDEGHITDGPSMTALPSPLHSRRSTAIAKPSCGRSSGTWSFQRHLRAGSSRPAGAPYARAPLSRGRCSRRWARGPARSGWACTTRWST
jgi:hypothetical protein